MVANDGNGTRTAWMDVAAPDYASLGQSTAADVCIVGAGIAGMTTAYLLAREGKNVVVLDDGPVGGGMTQRTTAHLTNAIDDRYLSIERLHGPDGARLAADSHTAAIDRIEQIVREERIDCDFERLDGYLVAARGTPADFLDRELKAAQRAGLVDVAAAARPPGGAFETGRCLRFPRQGQFHPAKYLAGLARALERHGGRIFCSTHAASVEGGDAARVTTTAGHTVAAGETFALVGPTGAGKSTIAKLVARYYDPTQGRVLLDVHDLRAVTLESLRRQLGVVPQEPFLFNDTIRGNLTFANPDASDEEVEEAVERLQRLV